MTNQPEKKHPMNNGLTILIRRSRCRFRRRLENDRPVHALSPRFRPTEKVTTKAELLKKYIETIHAPGLESDEVPDEY